MTNQRPNLPVHESHPIINLLFCSMSDKSKIQGAVSATRIRDNQRRSRAKRKEFLDSLQQRVQEYERRGMTATIEVQQAAKVVARENAALRRLLARHGVSRDEIDREIQAANGEPVVVSSTNAENLAAALRPQVVRMEPNRTTAAAPVCNDACKQGKNSCENVDPHLDELPNPLETTATGAHSAPPLALSDITSAAETSCIAAATIIAQMRGDGDDDFARTMLLGCHGTTDCRVKNTTLFQVLDEV